MQSLERGVVWEDGCFRIEDEDGHLWVTELLHPQAHERRNYDVPKRWRITFKEPETAARFIASRLRDSHNDMYHFHIEAKAVAW